MKKNKVVKNPRTIKDLGFFMSFWFKKGLRQGILKEKRKQGGGKNERIGSGCL
jgi:hypothetical protein